MDVARTVLAELDVELVFERVLEAARGLTGAHYAALGVLDESKEELGRFVTLGVDEATRQAIGPLPRGRGVLGELIGRKTPLRLADVGEHPRSYGFPPGHPPMHTFLGAPILVRGESWGHLYLTEKEGGLEFDEEDEEAVVMLAELAGFAIDHARRFTGAARRRDELERTVAALEATTQISRAVGGETDLDVILELVAKRGRALVSARALLIELIDGSELVVAAGAGQLPPGLIGKRLDLDRTLAGVALESGESQTLDVAANRSRFERYGLGGLGVDAAKALVVPLVFQGTAHGALLAIDRLEDGPAFQREDERLLEAFATSAAAAVATARSAATEHRRQRLAAAEAERGRWARELHDETLQGLAALRVRLSAARRTGQAESLEQAVDEVLGQLESEIAGLRSLITELRPVVLDELGAKVALEALCTRAAANGLNVDVDVELAADGEAGARHEPELETAIYRIVQEALTNATKHGRARRAVVQVIEQDSTLRVTVRDDGDGFDPRVGTDGFGLLGMRERAELLKGRLNVTSAPGEGTTVEAVLPVLRARARP